MGMGVIIIFKNKNKIYGKSYLLFLSVLIVFTLVFIRAGFTEAEYIKVIKEEVTIYEEPNNNLAIVGNANEGDIFKCFELGVSFSKIVLFSGKAQYINSLYITKIDYSVKVPDRAICREINRLIEDIRKNTKLEAENDYLKESIKDIHNNYKEYYDFLIDRNLLELFQSCGINPADYSQIIIRAKEG
jgi:hypothetical protein